MRPIKAETRSQGHAPGTRPITEAGLRREAWKFYFVLLAWPAYCIALPYVHRLIGWWSILFMLFPGAFLLNWMALLLHECWHRYVPNINNRFFYNLFSWLLLIDPQLFRLLHPAHHARVSTWDDREVHPFGDIKSRPLKILNNALELALGMLYIVLAWQIVVPLHPDYQKRYRVSSLANTTLMVAAFLVFVATACRLAFGLSAIDIVVPLLVSYWLGGMVLHYSTLIQHGNLIVAGNLDERNRWVRSLRAAGPIEAIFLVLSHQDQVVHHTDPSVYARPFRNHLVAAPPGAILITARNFLTIAWDMLRGRETLHGTLGIRVAGELESKV
jgi:fatty acid desaturase